MATAAEQTANKIASQKKAMEALNNSGLSPWVGGISFGVYTDSYDAASGDLETFMNKAESKIAGRYVIDQNGKKVKLYNAFLNLMLAGNVSNVKTEQVDAGDGTGTKFPFIAVTGASFGIFAVPSTVDAPGEPNPTTGQPYKRIDHSLQKAKTEKKPEPATV